MSRDEHTQWAVVFLFAAGLFACAVVLAVLAFRDWWRDR